MSRSELRSRALHRAVANQLREDPTHVARARARVTRWLADGTVHPEYARRWAEVLERPLAACIAALTEESERMDDLRQVSPFAGVLSPRERWQVLRGTS